jgi:DNA-directed RNA polymerases I, II, and III subunit RPABC5
MLIPICCFTCGKILANKWKLYNKLLKEDDYTIGEALDAAGFDKYCCRTIIMTHIDTIDELLKYDRYDSILPPQQQYY